MIRDASTSDISKITALMKSVAGFWDESWRPDVIERVIGSPDTVALVHEDGETLDGFICTHDVGFRAYLSELVVEPAVQGQGIGASLLGEVERRLGERGCAVLIADVWREAEPFYRAHGWTPPAVVLLRKRLSRAAAQPGVAADGEVGRFASSPRRS